MLCYILVFCVLLCQWICLFCGFDGLCELFGETIRNVFVIFVVECDAVVCGWRCSIG